MSLDSLRKIFASFCVSKYEFKSFQLSYGAQINYVEIKKPASFLISDGQLPRPHKTLVLMHGYGLGLGFFFENFDALANFQDSPFDRIVAIDWPGMGHSERHASQLSHAKRPASFFESFRSPIITEDKSKVNESIDLFIDGLHEWRVTDEESAPPGGKYILAGHSLGGYLSSRYAMKYNNYVDGLVLISPVGMQAFPQLPLTAFDWNIYRSWGFMRASLLSCLHVLWTLNLTPQWFLRRSYGTRGVDRVHSAISSRFRQRNWAEEKKRILTDYIHDISTTAPACGEYALNSLLKPVIYAQETPTVTATGTGTGTGTASTGSVSTGITVGVFARQPLHADIASIKVPILLMYGDNDWLRYADLERDAVYWKSQGADMKLDIVSSAGHHLYLDNPLEFHSKLFDWTNSNF